MIPTGFDDDRITVLDETAYRDAATVNFEGTVIAFARTTAGIVFNVLGGDGTPGGDTNGWSGFESLALPETVRPTGMHIINVPSEYDSGHAVDGLQDAGQPFRVLAGPDYIYLFRQAKKGTLLVNRLRLVRAASPADPKEVRYTLQPAWEVRFRRSGKPDTPEDDKDVFSFVSAENEPFVEPTIELFMIDGLTDGNFDAAFLPRNESALAALHVFVVRGVTSRVDVYALPMDAGGQFLLDGKTIVDGRIPPDVSFALTDERGAALPIAGRPSAAFYLKQERVREAGSGGLMVKRSGRLFLALEAGRPKTLATVDFGLSSDGTLARPAALLKAGPVGASPFTFEFDGRAWVELPAWTPGDAFGVELWIRPDSLDADAQVILGNRAAAGAPPFIRLRRGGAIEAAAAGATGQLIVARTPAGAVRQMAWSAVRVAFDAKARAPFVIEVNGSPVPLETSDGGHAEKTAFDVAGAAGPAGGGFTGALGGLITYGGSDWNPTSIVGQWDFQVIEYTDAQGKPVDPPLTPNARNHAAPGRVFGAHLIPSTRPVTGSSGELTWDANGLTIYTAYFKDLAAYGELSSSPFVLPGADGRLHVYFRGTDGRFSVMHVDAEVARATFEVPWQTPLGAAERGWMQFVATRAGRFMNDATVDVRPAAAPAPAGFCTVTLGSPSGRQEIWTGVPRSILPFAAVLAGNAIGDPGDTRVQTGERVYFDAHARRPSVYLPIAGNSANAMLGLVSQHPSALPLASVNVSPSGDGFATVTLRHRAPRWADAEIVQTWPGVPLAIDRFVETLRGQSPTFAYAGGTSNVRASSLPASSELVAANRIVIFFAPTVTKIARLSVTDGSTPATCTVTIGIERTTGGALSAAWADVPRAQQAFAATLQGENRTYDYRRATGDSKVVSSLLVVTTDGAEATVEDTEPDRPSDAGMDLRLSASLLALVVTAPTLPSETVPMTAAPVLAARLQSATVHDGTDAVAPKPIDGGSTLFRAIPASVPNSGAAGLVADTAACPGGRAPLTLQGFEGGWVPQAPRRTLDFHWSNWVQFETSEAKAPNISALAIQGDSSVELWCRPTAATPPWGKRQRRLLTFNRTPRPAEGGDPVRYLAGLEDAPGLDCARETRFLAHAATKDGTFSLWFKPAAAAGSPGKVAEGEIGFIGTHVDGQSLILLSIGSDQKIHASFTPSPSSPQIVGQSVVVPDHWSNVAITYVTRREPNPDGQQYRCTVALFVNGVWQGEQTYVLVGPAMDLPGDPASVLVGSWMLATLPMVINGVALFDRALPAADIARYVERRIPDDAAGLLAKWMLTHGEGDRAINSAPSGSIFDVPIRPFARWRPDGVFSVPVLGHGDNVALLFEPILREWTHLAMSHQAGGALRLQGRDYADCGHDETLNLDDVFTIETWVQPAAAAVWPNAQAVISKGEDYTLSIAPTGEPQFAVKVAIDGEDRELVVTAPNALPVDRATYVAVTYHVVTVQVKEKDREIPKYEAHIDLFVDGLLVASGVKQGSSYELFAKSPQRVSSRAPLNLGRSPEARGSRYFNGFLADVRLWSRVLSPVEIVAVHMSHRIPANRDGLISSWRFAEADGRIAPDPVGQNDARLSRANLRVNYPPVAVNTFYVDGREAAHRLLSGAEEVGGYGIEQFLLAKKEDEGHPPHEGFIGQLDDVRIWARQLTADQIASAMHTPLSGREPELRGYWDFSSGSGPFVVDRTGRGNDGTLVAAEPVKKNAPPRWNVSGAPLADEAPAVWNVLGGQQTDSQLRISAMPSVVEYADVQRDAYGRVFSVMKRAYVAIAGKAVVLVTGFKIGDLDTVYIGQAQSKPTLIGYIEGAPPIPSENQTLPSWRSGFGGIQAYSSATSVVFQEADDTTYTFKTDRATGETHKVTTKAGGLAKTKIDISEGLGLAVGMRVVQVGGKLGGQFGYEAVRRLNRSVDVQTGMKATLGTTLTPGGAWEPGTTPEEWVNPVVGRRFIPNNTGLAVVKSLTVDLVASVIRGTGAMVKITAVPNPDIPEDVNLIDFPIDPYYVKNGTLDGKVGLAADPDYPRADLERGSYFRPIEAYAIKRRLERADAQLEAYFQQYDEGARATRLRSGGWNDFEAASRDTRGYDWARHLAKRSIVNTYVWTAGGGGYAEQTQPVNVYTESHGAIASETFSGGASLSVKATISGFGPYLDFDYLFSSATAITVVKTKSEGASFALMAKASPDTYLYAPRIAGGDVTFANAPTEGKVDGYRYMAIYAAPDEDHTQTFFRDVVDQAWLNTSRDPGAAALREATGAGNGPWRVLYRVTYVSRIPPKFQPAPAETLAPDVDPPANLVYNALLVQLVRDRIAATQPTPVEIGQAIATVIGTPGAPGPLASLLPWWAEFLRDSTEYAEPGRVLLALREDLLRYMLDDYASREAGMEARGADPAGGAPEAACDAAVVPVA